MMEKLSSNLSVCGIYMITNPDGKSYIGASINVRTRLIAHKSCSNTIWGGNTKLMQSIKKHGFFNHKFEILEACDRESLYVLEKKYIEKFQTETNGLNGENTAINYFKRALDAVDRLSNSELQLLTGKISKQLQQNAMERSASLTPATSDNK